MSSYYLDGSVAADISMNCFYLLFYSFKLSCLSNWSMDFHPLDAIDRVAFTNKLKRQLHLVAMVQLKVAECDFLARGYGSN